MKKIYMLFFMMMFLLTIYGCQINGGGNGSQTLSSITITEVDNIEVGETIQLEVKLTSLNGDISYQSSNDEILTVSDEGVVTGVSVGKATVTASVSDNNSSKLYTDSIEIVVIEASTPDDHVHEHIACETCGKCISEECTGTEDEQCDGHQDGNDDPIHECEDYASEWMDFIEFSCGQKGQQQIICNVCNEVLQTRTITKEHNYLSEVTKVKTCTVDGEIRYYCTNCTDSYTRKDYSVGHQKGDIEISVEATDNSLGTKIIPCTQCDYIFKEFGYVDNAYHKNGKLSVKGADLVNQYGEKVQLYGLSTHGLQWFSKVVNFDTICAIQENFGNNIIRFALYTDEDGYCDGTEAKKKQMLETLHKGIDIATQLGLYVIVDWHMVGAENVLDKNPLTYLEEAKEFFSYISEYYKDQDNILYEIMNEPNGSTTWADCKKYANEIIPLIRKNTDAIVLVGNPKWTADLNSVMSSPLVGYKNIMYTYHFYAADHSSTSQVVKAYDNGFPVFISEFGFMESSGDGAISETNGDKWKKVLDTRNISYVAWNISNSKGSASIFKYNTSDLSDVSDSNLKVWGVYLKNWYRAKSLNQEQNTEEEIKNVTVELIIDDEATGYLQCFIVSSGHSTSRLDYNWSSTDESILTISSYSTITIVGDGSCSIICKNKTTGATGVLDVVVKNGEIVSYTSRYTV